MITNNKCPICRLTLNSITFVDNNTELLSINCFRCGEYKIIDYLYSQLVENNYDRQIICNLSSWVHYNQGAELNRENFNKIILLPPLSLDEKAQRVLLYLSKKFPIPGERIIDLIENFKILNKNADNKQFSELRGINLLDIYSFSWITDITELAYILQHYLVPINYLAFNGFYKILPEGWRYLDEIKNKKINSNKIFIAMRFKDDLLKFADEYIEPAINEAGYDPIRIDKKIHDNIVDDEIISSIRKSKLIISDFTDNSSGVYFETGFARGLNLPVIYLCEKQKFEDEKQKPHFDVNHYPFLLWERDKGEKIKKELQLRIEALVGRGLNSEKNL